MDIYKIPFSVLALLLSLGTLLQQGILRCFLHSQGMLMRTSHCPSWVSCFLPRHTVSNSSIICAGAGAATGSRPACATWHTHRYWTYDCKKRWGLQIRFAAKICR